MRALPASIALALALAAVPAITAAQTPQSDASSLEVTVADPSGAVIPGARVIVRSKDGTRPDAGGVTNERGVAAIEAAPGHYSVDVEFPGFDTGRIEDVRVRSGRTRREVRLAIAHVAEDVEVGRSARDRGLDARGDTFGNVLTPEQIDALPDDPDDMKAALEAMAGPGAVVRVDGFRGGRLPPKSQIRGIRFRRDMFAAENHGGGMVFVDITTAPGLGPLRGTMDFAFRDESMNARDPLSRTRGDEQRQNYGFTLDGTLVRNRTSFSIATNGLNAYDSQTIFAAVPAGEIANAIRRPTDNGSFSARVDHALTKALTLKGSYQLNGSDLENLGVGDFDLPSRAYSRDGREHLARVSVTGSLGRSLYAESRVQFDRQTTTANPLTDSPALVVLGAFTAGGAQVSGRRQSTTFEAASDIDYAHGRHAVRFGFLLDAGTYESGEVRNTGGTFTFGSLDAYEAGLPTSFSQRTGDPLVSYSGLQVGWYVQDDIRVAKSVLVSAGLRQEIQSHVDGGVNLGPRGAVTWSPFKGGGTTVRAGGGVFYEWYDWQVYEQTLRVDGVRQVDVAVRNPGYPDPFAGGADTEVLPAGRIIQAPGMELPRVVRGNIALEQSVGKYFRALAMFGGGRGTRQFRGRDVNAPDTSGIRPDPSSGTVTQVESTARSSVRVVNLGLTMTLPWHRTMLFTNYTNGHAMNEADGPLSLPSNSLDPGVDWGPAANDITHYLSGLFNMDLWKGFKLAASFAGSSGLPYTITTGFDDNGDTVSNDRPAGVGRNSVRGGARWDVGAKVAWAFGFGTRPASGGGPPTIMIRTIGGTPSVGGFSGGAEDKRWRFELYASASNLLNHTNPLTYAGVMTSPFFSQPTVTGPARKVELGVRFGF